MFAGLVPSSPVLLFALTYLCLEVPQAVLDTLGATTAASTFDGAGDDAAAAGLYWAEAIATNKLWLLGAFTGLLVSTVGGISRIVYLINTRSSA